VGNRHITILARQNGLNHPRLGLAIAKRQLKRAVDRNLIKRLARESFRLNQQVIGHFDVVVMVRSGIERLERQKVRKAFDRFWQELAERCDDS
jgi:ribonuclease P protein component